MMGTRQKLNGDGIDVTTGWRRFLCCLQRPGVVAKTKRRMRRQRRHAENEAMRLEMLDGAEAELMRVSRTWNGGSDE